MKTAEAQATDIVDALFAVLPQLASLTGWERDKARIETHGRVLDILKRKPPWSRGDGDNDNDDEDD